MSADDCLLCTRHADAPRIATARGCMYPDCGLIAEYDIIAQYRGSDNPHVWHVCGECAALVAESLFSFYCGAGVAYLAARPAGECSDHTDPLKWGLPGL
jgi:hypothetical protein